MNKFAIASIACLIIAALGNNVLLSDNVSLDIRVTFTVLSFWFIGIGILLEVEKK